jgi:2-polyprenyl-3-methyl-5-hydroxy-6-metoxy-1,4-benzoquinol methylase
VKEPVLEPLLRRLRINRVLPHLKQYPNCKLLDIGCGWGARLLLALEPMISSGVGVDQKAPTLKTEKLQTFSASLNHKLPFVDCSFDLITMLAVMEHLDDERPVIEECIRLLRPGGGLLITVPSWRAKPVLEFLSYRLNLVNPSEIRDHKRYYNRTDLYDLFGLFTQNLEIISHVYFQLGLNNCIFLRRL